MPELSDEAKAEIKAAAAMVKRDLADSDAAFHRRMSEYDGFKRKEKDPEGDPNDPKHPPKKEGDPDPEPEAKAGLWWKQ